MKRRMISVFLSLTLLLSTGSLVTAQESSDPVLDTQLSTQLVDETELHRDGDVPATVSVVDCITPPVSALIMSMLEQDLAYDQSDDTFYWSGLYYMLSFFGEMDSRVILTDDTLILPPEAVADYAAALFVDFNGLPQLPQELEDRISYVDGEYRLARGDGGLSSPHILSVEEQPDGSLLVCGEVIYAVDGEALCQFQATLLPSDGMFGYAICDAQIL